MRINLNEMFKRHTGYAIAGFNVFDYNDASAVIAAAEEMNLPVILMVNRGAAEHMPIKYMGPMLAAMADDARVDVCVHLDHAIDIERIREAVESGFSSVMYDGSQLSFEENVKNTCEVIAIAHPKGISVEAEIGSVGYSDMASAVERYTEPEEAKAFYEATGVDALAISVGTIHRLADRKIDVQFDRLARIRAAVDVPLVIHGATSVRDEELRRLSEEGVRKINLGTCLRVAFGNGLRREFENRPEEFDRIKLMEKPIIETKEAALGKLRLICDLNHPV